LEQIEPFASRAPYQISVGNHEYDWETGKEKHRHKHATDASGREKPYDPDWGNFGEIQLLTLGLFLCILAEGAETGGLPCIGQTLP